MEKKEVEFEILTKKSNFDLALENSRLQSQKTSLEIENAALFENKKILVSDIENLSNIHDKIFNKVSNLESLVGEIVTISSKNSLEIENVLERAKTGLEKIILVNDQNVEKTNKVINELPTMIFDLQRDIMDRKQFQKIKQI